MSRYMVTIVLPQHTYKWMEAYVGEFANKKEAEEYGKGMIEGRDFRLEVQVREDYVG